MIFGNVAYLGSLSRRSAVITAGSLILIVSKPPSISRVTVKPSPVFSNFDANVAYKKMSQLRLVAKVMKHVANAHWNDSQSPSILPTNLISQFPPPKFSSSSCSRKGPLGINHTDLYMPDAIPVTKPTVSKYERKLKALTLPSFTNKLLADNALVHLCSVQYQYYNLSLPM